MPINFGASTSGNDNSNINDCIKQIVFASGGNADQISELINNAIEGVSIEGVGDAVGDVVGDVVGDAVDSFTGLTSQIASNLETFSDGLPTTDVVPNAQLRPPINITKSATDIVNELQSRCTDFALSALDQIDPLERLDQLISIAEDLCGELNFTDLRKVIDKIDQTKIDIVNETISSITDPLEKAAMLNDMLVDAINNGSQDSISIINSAISGLGYEQLYGYINDLDPSEAIGRLQAELLSKAQLGDLQGVQDMTNAITALESSLQNTVDGVISTVTDEFRNLIPSSESLFDIPTNVIESAQDRINEALNLGNYEEIQNIVSAVTNVQNELLNTLQDLDPSSLMNQGVSLLNDALAQGDIDKYTSILDEMAAKLCTQDQLDNIPSLPNVPQINLPF